MWTYEQISGRLLDSAGELVGIGYSGFGNGKNNPDLQNVHDVGPICCGIYSQGEPHNTQTHGPFVIPLIPDQGNEMYGRSGFLMHGDSVHKPGTASLGCIIQSRDVREKFAASKDRLQVVREIVPVREA
jgi:hypothetical protein